MSYILTLSEKTNRRWQWEDHYKRVVKENKIAWPEICISTKRMRASKFLIIPTASSSYIKRPTQNLRYYLNHLSPTFAEQILFVFFAITLLYMQLESHPADAHVPITSWYLNINMPFIGNNLRPSVGKTEVFLESLTWPCASTYQ